MTDAPDDGARTALPAADAPRRRGISIERSVDEGVLIAKAAVTMDAKNFIIVHAIREGSPYDVEAVRATVRRALAELVTENNENAQRVQSLAVDVQSPGGAVDNNAEGYQTDDHPTLTKRGIIHVLLGEELARLSHDEDFVAEIAENARLQAWSEVGSAVESKLLANLPREPDQFYEQDKEARIRAFYNINLRALEKQAKRNAHHHHGR